MKEDIRKIIELAITAPSGDNAQPWRFEVKDNVISVINVPEADQSLYNFRQNASMVANGCLIENMIIVASNFGYGVKSELLPNEGNSNITASITLEKKQIIPDDLFKYIEKRSSNRRAYSPESLKNEEIKEIEEVEMSSGVEIKFMSGEAKDRLAKLLALNEKVVLENKNLHSFLFSHITWSEEEDTKRAGFFIKTFELKTPQSLAFSLFSNWNILSFFNKIGASRLVSNDNAKLYRSSGAIGAIIVGDSRPVDYLLTGRVLQRLWLKATRMNLSLQPLTGISFLHERIRADEINELSEAHRKLIRNAYEEMEKIFHSQGRIISMVFRIGHSDPPGARTRRKIPEITFV